MTLPQTTGDLLVATLQRLRCHALAFVSAAREVQLLCATGTEEADVRAVIKRVAVPFMVECEERHDVFARNRVRDMTDGPLLGRFLIAPVRDDDEKLLGVMLGYCRADGPEFTARETRIATRCARLLASLLSTSRDTLTGLLLPAAFEKRVGGFMRTDTEELAGALLYCNVDQLSMTNELFGLDIGDKVLRAVAKQLQTVAAKHPHAVVARLSGDRFAVFIPRCKLADAREIAEELRIAVASTRVATAVEPVAPQLSWGVAALRSTRHGFAHSLAEAEGACKSAKLNGGGRTEVRHEDDISVARRNEDLAMLNRLRAALDAERFEVFGQPINSLLQQEDARRYEVLVRILDEDGKLISPAQFMPAATRYHMLPRLDRCVINHALSLLRAAAGRPGFIPVRASFNLSASTIGDPSFVDWLFAQVDASGIPGQWLTFELSETAARANLEHTRILMQRLGDMGCQFALDNFGAGTSPLGNLRTLNFSSVKIDSSLVRDLLTDARAESMVRAIASLANALGLEIVAEHVETPAICMRLIEMKVQFGQGFAIGKPARLERILNPLAPLIAKAG